MAKQLLPALKVKHFEPTRPGPLPHTKVDSALFKAWMPSLLVSCGCCSKLPQTAWFQTIGSYSLTVLVARIAKSRCQQSPTPYRGSSRVRAARYWLLLASSTYSSMTSTSASVFTSSFLLFVYSVCLIKTLVIGFMAHLNNPKCFLHLKIFNLIKMTLFLNKEMFTASANFENIFWATTIQLSQYTTLPIIIIFFLNLIVLVSLICYQNSLHSLVS